MATSRGGGGGNGGGGEGNLDLLRDGGGRSDGGGEDDDVKGDGGGNGISFPGRWTKSRLSDPRWENPPLKDQSLGLTGKLVTSSSESDKMIKGMRTLARGVTKGQGVVIVL
ncbi:hypothetical protein Tco_1151215 [Tanacetum coccineum]